MLYYTTAELAKELNSSRQHVDDLRRLGAIIGTRSGHGYVFSYKAVDEYIKRFDGKDLSNPEKIRRAVMNNQMEEANERS